MKRVKFRQDENCEMLEVYIDGEHWRTGNFWDFKFENDVPDLLSALGIETKIENYSYDEEE